MRNPSFYEAIAILTGTIIGAGVLAIPYAISKAGFLTGLVNLVVLAAACMLIYLYVGETVLRTKGNYQLSGYARKYLGKLGGMLMAFTMVFGIYGALIAYIIGVGKTFATLFNIQTIHFLAFSFSADFLFSILFFVFASAIVYSGLKMVGVSEMVMSSIVILLLFTASLLVLPKINIANLASFNISKLFLPYGAILFALSGAVAVPEIKEQLSQNRKLLKKAILIGVLIPIALYFLFSLVTVGACGTETTEIATFCLGKKFGVIALVIGNLFAMLAMLTSFLSLGLGLKEMYHYDYKKNKILSWALACLVPLLFYFIILFFVKEDTFFKTISLSGGVTMTLEGILIVLMHRNAKKHGDRKPEYSIRASKIVSAVLIIIFLLGLLYTLLNFLGII